ncbi:transposase [Pseudomonas sp. BN515]|uniref:REP-associated tyrosine transposase n=1 Tax=Pseudomonas sp. BN515 TaxID=2567892 RepID=UPI0024538EDB|nr:transposase [Pseudomonas sp. BN515]MDH4871961.1 transposase [Pseudomonas sp. BN515]
MSNYRRARDPGALYFFTLVTHLRKPVLTHPAVRNTLREAIICTRERFPFDIHGWVLLPDHLHCIWQLPPDDHDFGRRWSIIKRQVSQQCAEVSPRTRSQQARRELSFWQRRFWEHRIRNEADYQRHMDYLHWNPVKHGLVNRVSDWPWSSFHCLVREGVYPADWGGVGEIDGKFGE